MASILTETSSQMQSMENGESDALSFVQEITGEILFVLCIMSGFMAYKAWERNQAFKRKQQSLEIDSSVEHVTSLKTIDDNWAPREKPETNLRKCEQKLTRGRSPTEMILAADSSEKVLRLWRMYEKEVAYSEVSVAVVTAYLDVEPKKLVKEVVGHLLKTGILQESSVQLLDLVIERKNLEVLDELVVAFKQHFFLSNNFSEAVVTAYAIAGDEARVDAFLYGKRRGSKAPVRSLMWAMRGFLLARSPDAALRYAKDIVAQTGQPIQTKVMTEIYKSFISAGRAAEGLFNCLPEFTPTPFAVSLLMEHCMEKSDLELAKIVEAMIKEKEIDFHPKAYESYLTLLLREGDGHARQVWSEMQANGLTFRSQRADPVIYQEYMKLIGK